MAGGVSTLRRQDAGPEGLDRRVVGHRRIGQRRQRVVVSPQFQLAFAANQRDLPRPALFGRFQRGGEAFHRHQRPAILPGPVLVLGLGQGAALVVIRILRFFDLLRNQRLEPFAGNGLIVENPGPSDRTDRTDDQDAVNPRLVIF